MIDGLYSLIFWIFSVSDWFWKMVFVEEWNVVIAVPVEVECDSKVGWNLKAMW